MFGTRTTQIPCTFSATPKQTSSYQARPASQNDKYDGVDAVRVEDCPYLLFTRDGRVDEIDLLSQIYVILTQLLQLRARHVELRWHFNDLWQRFVQERGTSYLVFLMCVATGKERFCCVLSEYRHRVVRLDLEMITDLKKLFFLG